MANIPAGKILAPDVITGIHLASFQIDQVLYINQYYIELWSSSQRGSEGLLNLSVSRA
jgi:hypothetical protein